jgi:spermidine synthase
MFENWIAASWDRLSPGRQILLGIEQWIYRETSPYQEVAIARVPEFGRGLFLDGVVQFLELDEYVYHEHLTLPPLLFHPNPKRVLIQGGGDGLALREVLRDPRVEEVVLVEIDEVVVDACKTHLSDLHRGSFDHPKARVIVQDVVDYLNNDPGRFDVVLGDLVDVFDPKVLALYDNVLSLTKQTLAPDAIVCYFGELAHPSYRLTPLYVTLARKFQNVETHRAVIDSFSSEYGFVLASEDVSFRDASTSILRDRAEQLDGSLRALVPERFPSAFHLPPYLEKHFRKALDDPAYRPETAEGAFGWIFPKDIR